MVVGVLVILRMTLSPRLEGELAALRSPLHTNLVIVAGTLTIFLVRATSRAERYIEATLVGREQARDDER